MNNCITYFTTKNAEEKKSVNGIYKRQKCEEARKSRIFNPKARKIGIDVGALAQQLEEKHKLRQEEQLIDEIYGEHAKNTDRITAIIDDATREEKRKLAQEINLFREHCQRPEDRREYDLNDPNRLKKQMPCRIRDDDPRCGMSSCQKFEGESSTGKANEKMKSEQFKAWLDEQILEKESKAKELSDADNAYTECMIARDRRAVELDDLETCCKRKLQSAFHRYNDALSREKRYDKERARKAEAEDNLAEIYNNLISDMLTENPDVAQSNLGPGRMIGFLYKGMNKQQLAEYRNAQDQQRCENKLRKEEEQKIENEWVRMTEEFTRAVNIMDAKLTNDQRKRVMATAEENIEIGKDQRENREYMNKIVYRNKITAAFYENFNKTAR